MAIAIKKEAARTRFTELIRTLIGEGRTGIKLTCPQGACRQEYVVYFGSVAEEEEMRWLFDQRIGQHHPSHLDLYTFDEPMPRFTDPEKAVTQPQATLSGTKCENEPWDALRSLRQKMRLRRALPAELAPARKPAGRLLRVSKVFAGCLAFAVAAVPIAARTPSLFGPK